MHNGGLAVILLAVSLGSMGFVMSQINVKKAHTCCNVLAGRRICLANITKEIDV
jgi:hypothetical protein